MKYLFLILSAFSFYTFAEDSARLASYFIVSDDVDPNLSPGESRFTFVINDYNASESMTVLYSINDVTKTAEIHEKSTIQEIVTPGFYDFNFVLNLDHYEISIIDLEIEPQHHKVVQLNFSKSDNEIRLKKPVIYLYPQEETEINIELAVSGELTFAYPEYNDGWSVTADSLGNITSGNEAFNYLFWEADQVFNESIIDRSQGAIIEQENLLTYLEESLTAFGFTSKERADFITYWIPQMKDATNLYIYFLFNEACDEFATLNIRPQPVQIARFYMLWADAKTNYNEMGITPQEIPFYSRDGFTVLEWGGAEISAINKTID